MTMDEKRRQALTGKGGEKPPATPPAKPPAPPQDEQAPAPVPGEVPFTPPPAPGPCGACGKELHIVKINSRVRAWVCTTIGCRLYRERVKIFSVPAPKPVKRPAPSKAKGDTAHGHKNKVYQGDKGRHQER